MPKKKNVLNGCLGEISPLHQDYAQTDDLREISHYRGTTTQMRTRTKHPEKSPNEKNTKERIIGS